MVLIEMIVQDDGDAFEDDSRGLDWIGVLFKFKFKNEFKLAVVSSVVLCSCSLPIAYFTNTNTRGRDEESRVCPNAIQLHTTSELTVQNARLSSAVRPLRALSTVAGCIGELAELRRSCPPP